jgi:predicted nucleic acid-binding protein
MIVVDTAIWIDHLHHPDAYFHETLRRRQVVLHPYVLGEIMLGSLRNRERVVSRLRLLPEAQVASAAGLEALIEGQALAGSGIGYVDAHLVASALLMPETTLWTRDRRLAAVAERLGVAHRPLH